MTFFQVVFLKRIVCGAIFSVAKRGVYYEMGGDLSTYCVCAFFLWHFKELTWYALRGGSNGIVAQ